jgi:Ni/Co efflux regulator RcnB
MKPWVLSLGLLALSATAVAADRTITCESRNRADTACYIGKHRGTELARQLSNASCEEGDDWWVDGGDLVVSNGCRGEFDIYDRGNYSSGYRGNDRRDTDYSRYNDRDREREYVDDRHRDNDRDHDRDRDYHNEYGATPYGNNDSVVRTIVCESTSKRAATCAIGRHGEVRLTRRLSDAACSENRDWWVRGPEIQVANGCRAEFTVYPQ